jgi:hypothetical protein
VCTPKRSFCKHVTDVQSKKMAMKANTTKRTQKTMSSGLLEMGMTTRSLVMTFRGSLIRRQGQRRLSADLMLPTGTTFIRVSGPCLIRSPDRAKREMDQGEAVSSNPATHNPRLYVCRHGERIDFVDYTWWERSARYGCTL